MDPSWKVRVVAEFTQARDDELLMATREHPEAFGVFYERHVGAVFSHVRRQGWNAEDALDLTAEVFAAALVSSTRYRPGEAPAQAWLFGIARNKLAKARRSNATEATARRKLGIPRLTFSDEALERVEQRIDAAPGVYARAVEALPPAEREAVIARVVDERDYSEIASAVSASPAAVRQRVKRGLAKLADLRKGEA
jgi:RNA polymerase sigma factor (sigma-70 family)